MSLRPVRGAAQLQVLFDQLADAVYLLDPATSDIVWGNRKVWESLGLRREAVLDHSALSLQKDVLACRCGRRLPMRSGPPTVTGSTAVTGTRTATK